MYSCLPRHMHLHDRTMTLPPASAWALPLTGTFTHASLGQHDSTRGKGTEALCTLHGQVQQ